MCVCLCLVLVIVGSPRTIAENIAYGVNPGGSGVSSPAGEGEGSQAVDTCGVSMDKIVEAAELANARDFIEEFPEG